MNFCIIVIAPGFEPAVSSGLLPEKGSVTMPLRTRDLSKLDPKRVISGRIIGPDGKPVAGAVLDIDGVVRGDTTSWGCNAKVDSMTVSDLQGEFHIVAGEDIQGAHVLVKAPGRCPRWFQLEPAKMALLRLKAGAEVRGRLVANGQPLAGVPLAMATDARQCGVFICDLTSATDADGRFVFSNVPEGVKLQLFATMDAMQKRHAAFRMDVTSANDGQPTELGDLTAVPAYRLTGRVILADGKPVPPNTRLMLSRKNAWDSQLVMIGEEGKFTANAVPGEQISFNITVPGYCLSPKNSNVNPWNRDTLTGLVNADVDGLKILLEAKGPPAPAWEDAPRPTSEEIAAAEQKPFRPTPYGRRALLPFRIRESLFADSTLEGTAPSAPWKAHLPGSDGALPSSSISEVE
ncbi:MAG: hypothetical protein ABJF10_11450 [Chthoniobacter sp.]|uniref:hypothetical protein n=1 Tax=Chthoniobacter sp. TaxID=2510640 RepID=UPI0032A6D892